MKHIRLLVTFLVSAAFVVILSACGGGGDGDDTTSGVMSFEGTYGGIVTGTISAPGLQPQTLMGSITIVINADGTVVTDPGEPFQGAGTISGNTLTASSPASSFNEPGFVCTGTFDITATGSGTTFNGTMSGNGLICNGVPFTFNGTFTVSKTAKALLQDTTLGDRLSEAVRQAINGNR